MANLLKPDLYEAGGTADVPDHPALRGGACGACGHVFFPMQAYGCERCGSLALAPRRLSGAGRLTASARVHLHAGKGREAPFTVVSVQLDDGPAARTLFGGDGPLAVGQRMVTALMPATGPDGEPCIDLRFIGED
jgi:uncharacterized OB-fold protein